MGFPVLGGSITDSLSPMIADGGAVVEATYASGFPTQGAILLSHGNLTNATCAISTGEINAA